MERHIETELHNLRELIVKMGAWAERAVDEAVTGLLQKRAECFIRVRECEEKINELHLKIDDVCFKICATQAPMATDLRVVFAASKINTDLERLGDQAMNICEEAQEYLKRPQSQLLGELPTMCNDVKLMIRQALDAFVREDDKMARAVVDRDDYIDELNFRFCQTMIQEMHKSPDLMDQALELMMIARNLERLADHATNIAEEVVFVVSGKDIRHPGLQASGKG